MPAKFNETYPTQLYSHRQSSACGMKLPENLEMIVVGHVSDSKHFGPVGEVYTGFCSFLDAEFKQNGILLFRNVFNQLSFF